MLPAARAAPVAQLPTGPVDVVKAAAQATTDEMALATHPDSQEMLGHCPICSHAPLGAGVSRRTQLEAHGDFPPGPPVGARSILHWYDDDRGHESPTKHLVTEVGCAHPAHGDKCPVMIAICEPREGET